MLRIRKLIRTIKRWFGIYEVGCEYFSPLKDIIIPPSYKHTKIEQEKWLHKLHYWENTGNFESPILIDKDFRLVDGFSSCKIAFTHGIEIVPVRFVSK